MTYNQAMFTSELGKQLKKEIEKLQGYAVDTHCFMANSLFLLVNTLDYCIIQGLRCDDPFLIRELMV